MKRLLTNNTLYIQKLAGILTEAQFHKQMNEGWRETIVGAAMTAASLLGSVKGQNANTPNPQLQGTSQNSSKSISVPMGALFQSGRYFFVDAQQKAVTDKLGSIGEFIAKNPGASFSVTIQASESQVPNYDAEVGGRVKLEAGQLAQKRAETAKFTVETYVEELKKQGSFKGNVTFSDPQITIGKTPYRQGEDVNQDKFTREQSVNVIISLTSKDSVKTVPAYKVVSNDEQRLYNGSKHAIGDAYHARRNTDNQSSSGNLNTGYSDILVKWIDKMGNETGEKSLVDANWWNTNIGNHTELSDDQITGIKNQSSLK